VTGFQAMTVAPLVGGKPDLSQVTVSYAGTNPAHRADLSTDMTSIVDSKLAKTQAEQAMAYAEKVRSTYGTSSVTVTGHSLGGYLALLVAAEFHLPAVTFNGPDPWDVLSPQARDWVKVQIAAGKNPLHNYVNEWDVIGNFHGNGTGAADYVKAARGQWFLNYHNLDTGFGFAKDGSVIGSGAQGRTMHEIMDNLCSLVPPGYRQGFTEMLTGAAESLHDPAIASAVGGAVSGVMVLIDTVAAMALASRIFSTMDVLRTIKTVNSGLVPQLADGLNQSKDAIGALPYITERDIEQCVAVHRLQVHANIDEHAVAAVDRKLDDHVRVVDQLANGISNAVATAGAQDQLWASLYAAR